MIKQREQHPGADDTVGVRGVFFGAEIDAQGGDAVAAILSVTARRSERRDAGDWSGGVGLVSRAETSTARRRCRDGRRIATCRHRRLY